MSDLIKMNPSTFVLPKMGAMRVPGLLIANESQIDESLEKALTQVRNVACLPGIVGYSIAMPDIHWGYGFPIGGVAAMDLETGVISPGGVGYDINCGVRIGIAPIPFATIGSSVKKALLDAIFRNIPSGTGQGHLGKKLTCADYKKIAATGARWSIEQGFGFQKDLNHIESDGMLDGADLSVISSEAKERGSLQLGSIGSGNHFVEIGEVGTIFDKKIANDWKVELGMTYILVHSGSRGFGHQVCQDYLTKYIQAGLAENLPDRQLCAAPIRSDLGQQYWSAMATAANYAFNNRQQIFHGVRKAFQETCALDPEKLFLIYDVCHNIAKMETHGGKKLCVHRKGATRAFGKESLDLAPIFRKTGQPVLVPGDMGKASHLMVGLGNPLTWCSSCHGAGRAKSRVQSMAYWKGRNALDHMLQQGVQVAAHSYRTIAEEMPDAYKDVDVVVDAVQEAGLAAKVARLKPAIVLKG
jgi:tRNA-splicing ligase RtcB (3'-phosphate/5'-hydroxy nucleic acid ligase)